MRTERSPCAWTELLAKIRALHPGVEIRESDKPFPPGATEEALLLGAGFGSVGDGAAVRVQMFGDCFAVSVDRGFESQLWRCATLSVALSRLRELARVPA